MPLDFVRYTPKLETRSGSRSAYPCSNASMDQHHDRLRSRHRTIHSRQRDSACRSLVQGLHQAGRWQFLNREQGDQMTTATPEKTEAADTQQRVQKLRDLFADAPEVARTALANVLRELKQRSQTSPPPAGSAGRIGMRQGKVSELTMIASF